MGLVKNTNMTHLLEFEQISGRVFDVSGHVGGFGLQLDLCRVLDDPLDRHLDELVEGVELLPD